MKRGAFHFLGRKKDSLFDTNLKAKEMVTQDNLELMLDSSAIPESGTAKVRSRPTVKHYISSSEVLQGCNVPTPTVPVIPAYNEIKTNGLVSGDRWSNGSALSVPDLVEEEEDILVPPPPSVAPPPPPAHIIPPPPDFMGDDDIDDLDLASIQPPSMPPPKPPSLAPSLEDEDLSSLRPPPMAPPKPPSTCSSASSSSLPISTTPPSKVPDVSESPKCPAERQHKAPKIPPPKPVRLSSMPSMDGPPQSPAPPPPVHCPTPSSFNPQNTAKLYSVPKTSILTEHVDRDTRPKSILVLEDSVSRNSVPVPVQVNGKTSSVEKDLQDLKATLQATLPSQKPASLSKRPPNIESVSRTPPKVSPKLQKQPASRVNSDSNQAGLDKSPKATVQTNLPSQKPASLSKRLPGLETVSTTPPKVSPKLQKQPAARINSESNLAGLDKSPKATIQANLPSPKVSPKLQKQSAACINSESNQAELDKPPSQSRQFSPLIDCKLRNLKGSEPSGVREGPAATPLALLMAAKERDKHRSSLSRENSTTQNEQSTASIQPIASNPNSFVVIPRAASSSSLDSQGTVQENTKPAVSSEPTITNPTVGHPRSPALVQKGTSSPKPAPNRISGIQSSPASSPVIERQSADQSSSPSDSAQDQENEEMCMPLLPPPPEFANAVDLDEAVESPPSFPAPDPPVKSAPSPPTASPIPPAKSPSVETPPRPSTPAPDPPVKSAPSPTASPVPPAKSPSPLPKPQLPAPPKLPPPETDIKPRLPVQTKSKSPLTQSPTSSLSASQATLLSILQKKMLEMDHKMTPMSEPESNNGDDWGNPLSDEETNIPAVFKAPPKNKTSTIPSKPTGLNLNKTSTMPSKTTGLDMRELESRVAKKLQEKSSSKGATSNGPESKQQFGMTFTVRPGTKQPITLVSKGESS